METNEDHPIENERENDTSSPIPTFDDVENKTIKRDHFGPENHVELDEVLKGIKKKRA